MIYGLIFTHWLADFVCQTDDMAKNKSKSNYWLFRHILMYGSVLWLACWVDAVIIRGVNNLPNDFRYVKFVLINAATHAVVDYFTSRYNSKMWSQGKVHAFFVGVGFDQALHMATLFATYEWLLAK